MSQVKLTVLMTVYNGAAYLHSSIQGVLKQTYQDFEFLIIDDCSTDDSQSIIQQINDSRIRCLRNEENKGQTASLNVGLKEAAGDWIARIDADDIALPNWLDDQVELMLQNPECAVMSAGLMVMNGSGRLVRKLNSCRTLSEMIFRSMIASPVNHGGCLMNRAIVCDHQGYDEHYKVVADYDLWSRLMRAGHSFAPQSKSVMAIRFHEQSVSAQEKDKAVIHETCTVMKANMEFLLEDSVCDDDVAKIWQLCFRPEKLNQQEFLKSCEVLQSIYAAVKVGTHFFSVECQKMIKQSFTVLFMKRILFLLAQRRAVEIRVLSEWFVERFGRVWPIQLMQTLPVRIWPAFYQNVAKLRAQTELKRTVVS